MPAFSVDNQPLVDYLTKMNLIGVSDKNRQYWLQDLFDYLRQFLFKLSPHQGIWAFLSVAFAIIFTIDFFTP